MKDLSADSDLGASCLLSSSSTTALGEAALLVSLVSIFGVMVELISDEEDVADDMMVRV